MKLKTFAAIASVGLFFSVQAQAACQYKYDYQSGNSYQVCDNFGNTTIFGSNARTGSMWSQTQQSNGNYFGTDRGGNFYSGNNNTRYYHNTGTGKTCYGTGYARTCY